MHLRLLTVPHIQIACNGIFKYCLRDMLGENQRETFFFFLDTISLLLAESHDPCVLDNLGNQMSIALARLERDYPVSIHVINIIVIIMCIVNSE